MQNLPGFSRIQRAACRLKTTLGLLTALLLSGCGSEPSSSALKVGVMAGPEAEVMETAVAEARERYQLEVELVEFTDYISPNVALADGSIDLNAFQHRPYLESMVADRGFKLVAVGNTFVYPIGAYSRTLDNMEALAKGARVAIPNDPSNEGRTLILLDRVGLIKLKDNQNLAATPRDILANPLELEFVELEAAQLPRALEDVDLAFINTNYAVPAGLVPTRDALLLEGPESPYVNLIVARENNRDDPRIAQLVSAYQSQAVVARADQLFKGGAVPGWNY